MARDVKCAADESLGLAGARPGGTYALVLASRRERSIQIGKLGVLRIRPGSYVYVGSAFGPGGVRGRLGRHARSAARLHWHVDYLRRETSPREAWYSLRPVRREHEWAGRLRGTSLALEPFRGFGASDCSCTSHLFFFEARPSTSSFRRWLRAGSAPLDTLHRVRFAGR